MVAVMVMVVVHPGIPAPLVQRSRYLLPIALIGWRPRRCGVIGQRSRIERGGYDQDPAACTLRCCRCRSCGTKALGE